MAIFGLSEVLDYLKDDMARSRGRKTTESSDSRLIDGYVDQLVRAVDKSSSDAVIDLIRNDARLSAGDVISIAQLYNRGGKKVTSKKAAFASISKRALEIRHFHAKNKIAEKVRPW